MHHELLIDSSSLIYSNNLNLSKFKAFQDDKFRVVKMLDFVMERLEYVFGKQANAGYHHFRFAFSEMFSKVLFHRVVKSQGFLLQHSLNPDF